MLGLIKTKNSRHWFLTPQPEFLKIKRFQKNELFAALKRRFLNAVSSPLLPLILLLRLVLILLPPPPPPAPREEEDEEEEEEIVMENCHCVSLCMVRGGPQIVMENCHCDTAAAGAGGAHR